MPSPSVLSLDPGVTTLYTLDDLRPLSYPQTRAPNALSWLAFSFGLPRGSAGNLILAS